MGRLEAVTRLPADTRLLAKLLAERLDLAVGRARVELELVDGRSSIFGDTRKSPAAALDQFGRSTPRA